MKNRLKIGLVVLTIVSVMGLGLIGCASKEAPAPAAPTTAAPTTVAPTTPAPKTIKLKYADPDGINFSRPQNAMIPALDELEARSKGRIKVDRYWGGTLVSAASTEPAISSGLIDFGIPRQYEGGPYLLCALGGLPFAAEKDGNNVTRAVNQLVAKGYMDAALKKANLHFLTHVGSSGYHIGFRYKKPMKFEEFAGIKIRDPGGYMGTALKLMGMSPVTLIPAEAYDAFAKGVVEAIFWHMTGHTDLGLHELYKSFLLLNLGRFTTKFVAFNADRWNALPDDIRKLISEVWGEHYMELELQSYAIGGVKSEEMMRKAGIEFYSLPETEMKKIGKAVIPAWDDAIRDMDKLGLPGRQVMTEFVTYLKAHGENPPWTP